MKTTTIKNWLKTRPAIALLLVLAAVIVYLVTDGDVDIVDDVTPEETVETVEDVVAEDPETPVVESGSGSGTGEEAP